MATARPPGGTPQARLELDLSAFRAAPGIAREAARQTAREISQAFKAVQNEQRIALTQQQQTLAVLRAQQAQITATTRAESSVRVVTARTEAQAAQQAARVAANTAIEEQRRITAQTRAELRIREAEQRASLRASQSGGAGGFGRGVAGAALGSLGGPVGAIAGAAASGAVPVAAGLALVEGGRYAVQASATATAYERQRAAAVSLAGSQGRLNELMTVYHAATRRASTESQALANLTNLMAQGFADSSEELDTFLRGVRGASVAMGQQQEFIISRLQLEMMNQTGQRLNEIGLGMEEVRERADALRLSNRNLTQEQAYQQAVLEELLEKYGAVADSPVSDPTGPERVATAWGNMSLQIGRVVKPLVDVAGNLLADDLEREIQKWQTWEQIIRNTAKALGMVVAETPRFNVAGVSSAGSIGGARTGTTGSSYTSEQIANQTAAKMVRFDALNQIGRDAANALVDVTRQTSEQRANIIRQYEVGSAREAEDFGRQRLNAERRFNLSLLDVAQDSARQRARWEADTAREINEAAAERDERIADVREASAERIGEMEERFAKDQEKRTRAFGERIREAAASLNAVQVREMQRQRRIENEEASQAHDEAVENERESLQERIDEANEAFAKQEQQQRDSLQRRIELQAEDDRLRIEEMKAAWEAQREQEDIERGIRLGRQAEDHAAQLIELDNQAAARIEQIKNHAQKERDEVEEQFRAAMIAAGFRNQAWEDHLAKREQAAIDSFDRTFNATFGRFGAPIQGPSQALPLPSLVPPVSNTRSGGSIGGQRSTTVNIQPGAISIVPPPGVGLDDRFATFIYQVLAQFWEDLPQ